MNDSVKAGIRAGFFFAAGATVSKLDPGAPVWAVWVALVVGVLMVLTLDRFGGEP